MEVKKATISPSTMAYDNVSPSLAPVPTNDGTLLFNFLSIIA